jgi:hypothetical protein
MEGEDVEVVEVAKHAIEEHFAIKKQIEGFEETMCGTEATQLQLRHLRFLSSKQQPTY